MKIGRLSGVYWSALLVATTLPLSELPGTKYNSMAIILLVLSWLVESDWKYKWKKLKEQKWVLMISSVFLIHFLGIIHSSNHEEGFREVQVKLGLILFPLVFATIKPLMVEQWRNILMSFVVSCLAVSFYLFKDGWIYEFWNLYNPHHITIGKMELLGRVYCSVFLVFSGAILIFLLFNSEKYISWSNCFIIICLWYIVYVEGILIVKMALLASVVTLVSISLVWLYFKGKKLFWAGISGVAVSMFLIIVLKHASIIQIFNLTVNFQPISLKEEIEFTDTSLSTRMMIWKASFMILLDSNNWIIGVGTGDVPDVLGKAYQELGYPAELYKNPHNEYLSVILKVGIVGFILVFGCIGLAIKAAFRHRSYLFFTFLIMSTLSMCTESWFSRHSGVVFYSFFYSLFMAYFDWQPQPQENQPL